MKRDRPAQNIPGTLLHKMTTETSLSNFSMSRQLLIWTHMQSSSSEQRCNCNEWISYTLTYNSAIIKLSTLHFMPLVITFKKLKKVQRYNLRKKITSTNEVASFARISITSGLLQCIVTHKHHQLTTFQITMCAKVLIFLLKQRVTVKK